MPRESETYRDTLALLIERGNQIFPGNMLLGQKQVAELIGESTVTVWRKKDRYGFVDGKTTYPKLARALSREA